MTPPAKMIQTFNAKPAARLRVPFTSEVSRDGIYLYSSEGGTRETIKRQITMWIKWLVKYGAGGHTQWTGKQRKNELTVHLKICAGYGESHVPDQPQFPYPKIGENVTLGSEESEGPAAAGLHLVKGPFEGRTRRVSPSATESWHPEPLGGGRPKRAKLYPLLERGFSHTLGVPTPSPDPPSPRSRTTPGGNPSIPSLLPVSPSVARRLSDRAPESRRRVAPPLPESPRPTGAPAHLPTRRRQGLPNPAGEGCRAGASQAPPGPTCEAGGGSVCSPTGGLSRALEGEARRKREVRSADRREKAAWARGPRGREAFDPAPPPPPPLPLGRHQARRRRRRSPNRRTPQTSKEERPSNRSGNRSWASRNSFAPTSGPAPVQGVNKRTQIISRGVRVDGLLPFSVSSAGCLNCLENRNFSWECWRASLSIMTLCYLTVIQRLPYGLSTVFIPPEPIWPYWLSEVNFKKDRLDR